MAFLFIIQQYLLPTQKICEWQRNQISPVRPSSFLFLSAHKHKKMTQITEQTKIAVCRQHLTFRRGFDVFERLVKVIISSHTNEAISSILIAMLIRDDKTKVIEMRL